MSTAQVQSTIPHDPAGRCRENPPSTNWAKCWHCNTCLLCKSFTVTPQPDGSELAGCHSHPPPGTIIPTDEQRTQQERNYHLLATSTELQHEAELTNAAEQQGFVVDSNRLTFIANRVLGHSTPPSLP